MENDEEDVHFVGRPTHMGQAGDTLSTPETELREQKINCEGRMALRLYNNLMLPINCRKL